jgi:hypothetical protein
MAPASTSSRHCLALRPTGLLPCQHRASLGNRRDLAHVHGDLRLAVAVGEGGAVQSLEQRSTLAVECVGLEHKTIGRVGLKASRIVGAVWSLHHDAERSAGPNVGLARRH